MSASASSLVQLSNVRIDRSGRTILRDVSLQVPKGSITAVLGPSGSGKSTLLAALTGELRPVAGEVTLFGRPVPHDSGALLEMRKSVGVLLQGNGLLTDLTVAENVALPLRTHTRLPTAVLRRLVEMKLHAVGLLAAADAWPRELSGGMARRVALARALALDPPLMIYDEPLTGLDPIASGVIMSLIQRLNHSLGLTSIIVSHHVHETLPICDQVIAIANGGIVFQGTPEALQSSQDPLLRQFLHDKAFQAPPYTTSQEFVDALKRGVDPKWHGLIDDLFWKITFFDNRLTEASARKLPDGRYQVTMQVHADKSYVDGTGKEVAAVPDVPLDIGVFAAAPRNGVDGKPLYLAKRVLPKGDSTITVVVDAKPAEAGVDPYNELIDRIPADNRHAVSLQP